MTIATQQAKRHRRESFRDGTWHSRGYIPHNDDPLLTQFVTVRLFDSLPQHLILELQQQIKTLPKHERQTHHYKKYEKLIDQGLGQCFLKEQKIAITVEQSLLHFQNVRYYLHAWVIMPNHLHALLTPLRPFLLSQIIGNFKSFSANAANKKLNRKGPFWFKDYFDRYIRNEEHFNTVRYYIEQNPVTAGLCADASDWPFSSARISTA
jgi:REP element-mobilizing transposase RayT